MAALGLAGGGQAADPAPRNLALAAHATAFESYQGTTPDLANDGKPGTRWSGIPGHNQEGWYELDWDHPVHVGEVVIVQHDRYVMEMEVEVWDDGAQEWVVLEHLGKPEARLPLVVVCRFAPQQTSRLRLAHITNGPSFNEVEVYETPAAHPAVISLASDLAGGFIGMVCDAWGRSWDRAGHLVPGLPGFVPGIAGFVPKGLFRRPKRSIMGATCPWWAGQKQDHNETVFPALWCPVFRSRRRPVPSAKRRLPPWRKTSRPGHPQIG